jgi:DNA replication protein DnaD
MKKYNEKDKQSLKEIDNILKDWKRKGCTTPDEVKAYKPEANKKKNDNKLNSTPSFNIDEITKNAMLNDDYDI